MTRLADLKHFYSLLERQSDKIGRAVPLAELDTRGLPKRGLYFFFEPDEKQNESGSMLRVVRVGTHALGLGSRSTLTQRLVQHRGNRRGYGNHRGSIFRLLVGQSLLAAGLAAPCPSWGLKSDARSASTTLNTPLALLKDDEAKIELAVSEYIGAMKVTWIEISDEPGPDSQRGRIERNAIALLSNRNRTPLDAASDKWLGLRSNRILVRESGLWNQNHVDESYAPSFLVEVEGLIEQP